MTDKNTVDAIVAGATASRSQLASLDHTLQGAIDKIVLGAAKQGRELTDDEKKQRKLLRAQQADVQEAFEEWHLRRPRGWTILTTSQLWAVAVDQRQSR
jgi:Zn-dependent oligopeptidase